MLVRTALVSAALLALFTEVHAQAWPARPIKIIVSTGPGLATDIMARLLSERLSRQLGQQMFVENVPGAAGMIGAQAAARSAPDGYTFYFAPASAVTSNVYLYKSVPYDPAHDFTPVAMICDSGPFALSVQPDLPIKTVSELVTYSKANPGKLSYGVDTSSGYGVIIGDLLTKRGGIDWVRVPYKSTAQMLQDTASGTVQLMISSLTAVRPFAESGRLRRLAVSSDKRFPGLDDLPTIAETIPKFRIDGWFALLAPTGTPAAIVQRLNREIDGFLKDPAVSARLISLGLATSGAGTPESTGQFIQAERNWWQALVKELDIQPQ